MAYDSALEEEDANLSFLLRDLEADSDETDSVSKLVINFERGSLLPRYFVSRESDKPCGVRQENTRLRTVSERTLQKFDRNAPTVHNGVAALLTFENKLNEGEVKRLSSLLRGVGGGKLFYVLYHAGNFAILLMEKASYLNLGEKIVKENGAKFQNISITTLEAISLDSVPSCFLELSTPKSNGEVIQEELSRALVTFCGSFKYLCLYEAEQPDLKPSDPSLSLTLLFSKLAQANAKKFNDILSDDEGPWMRYECSDFLRVPFEKLFLLKEPPCPLIGMVSGSDIPGVRIAVSFGSKKQEMRDFYSFVTGVKPVCHCNSADTSFTTFPVARNVELLLIYNPVIQTQPSGNIAICIRISDHQKISDTLKLASLGASHWETYDPVGNRVILFMALE